VFRVKLEYVLEYDEFYVSISNKEEAGSLILWQSITTKNFELVSQIFHKVLANMRSENYRAWLLSDNTWNSNLGCYKTYDGLA
jgi:hypothetical protein